MNFKRGDFVSIMYEGRSYDAMILIASENGKSLYLGCGPITSGEGMFLSGMPVLRGDDGVYLDLINSKPVDIELTRRPQ